MDKTGCRPNGAIPVRRLVRAALVLVAWFATIAALAGAFSPAGWSREPASRIASIEADDLPKEARHTIALIKKGGPFPYRKDGTVFGNFEKRLPLNERGYYLEYTVPTPGARDRGARRLVAGKRGELFYTEDHYQSFKRVRE